MANRAQIYKYKGNQCACCGRSVQEMIDRYGTFDRMFELHHIDPDTKDPNFKNLIRRTLSFDQIEEVDKCTLLCSQCHSVIHAQNIRTKLQLVVSYEEREVSQVFDGWIMCDGQDKSVTFATNQRFKLFPIVVAFGNGKRMHLFAIELEKRDYLVNWLYHVKDLQGVQVFGKSADDLCIKIEYLAYKKIRESLDKRGLGGGSDQKSEPLPAITSETICCDLLASCSIILGWFLRLNRGVQTHQAPGQAAASNCRRA